MANKIQVTLDAAKLRNLVSKRSYKNKEGQEVQVQEVKFELIEMKPESHKTVFTHEMFKLVKTHFAVAQQTKEEREAKADANYIGEGITQIWNNETTPLKAVPVKKQENEDDDLPF